jgi:Bucentaur or craniofacial development
MNAVFVEFNQLATCRWTVYALQTIDDNQSNESHCWSFSQIVAARLQSCTASYPWCVNCCCWCGKSDFALVHCQSCRISLPRICGVKDIRQRWIFGRRKLQIAISMQPFDTDSRKDALTPAQQKRVDSTFQDLFGYPWGTQFSAPSTSSESSDIHTDDDFALLTNMLGPTPAARILSRCHSLPSFRRLHRQNVAKTVTVHKRTHTVKTPIPVISRTSRPLKNQSEDYRTTQGNSNGTLNANDSAATKKPSGGGGGVDVLLQQLNASQKVSTVAKTSADWDQFKQATGLTATLEEQADSFTSYLHKQDFLSRVDHRTFDLEKRDRDAQRAKRGL